MRGLLQRWTKSSIIPISKEESVWRNKRPRSRTVSFAADRLLTWSTITSGSLGAMILSRTMPTLFTTGLRNDDIQEFDSKWDGILLSMTKIPHDDILEGLYKLRLRESEKLKTVLELYDLAASTEWGRPLAFDVGTHHHAFVDQFFVLYGSLAEQARRWVMSSFTYAGDSWISTNESCRTWCTRLLGLALAWRDTSRWCPAAFVLCNRKGSAGRQHNLCLNRWPRSVWRNWVLRKKNEHWSPGWDVGAVQNTMPVVSEA